MPTNQVLFVLLAKSIVTLLPLVPAIILFKYLPSTATVSGPLSGLRGLEIKFGGAFGAYFIVFLFLWHGLDIDQPHYWTWTVTGRVVASEAGDDFHPNDITWRVRPPDVVVNTDGTFKFQVAVLEKPSGEPTLPTVLVDLPGFVSQTIHLDLTDATDASSYGSAGVLKREYRRDSREVRLLEPVMMKAKSELPPFAPSVQPTAVAGHPTPRLSESEILP
ncbi:MAG: hypothetical protein HYY76_08815 [Acidobacteria bacterium]|nr:hypothetical protein [Acidobacteriota bacterium]